MKEVYELIRANIKELSPYSTARDDCKLKMDVYLDANENPYNNGSNRYPSPFQYELKKILSSIKKVPAENIFLGNGSDEAIDLVYRVFCEPKESSALIVSPTYGMYGVAAKINNVRVIESLLDDEFGISANKVLSDVQNDTKVIFICSPNNPTGNLLDREEIEKIIMGFDGIVVIDEAYIDFADAQSFSLLIDKYPNLVVLQTLSKAWGMAGLRIGIAFSNSLIINTFNKVKYPYNISVANQEKAIEVLRDIIPSIAKKDIIVKERIRLADMLETMSEVSKVFKSDSNFLLVKFKDKDLIFNKLKQKGIIVRDRSSLPLCNDCLRITVGTPEENDALLSAIAENGICRPNGYIAGTCNKSNTSRIGKCIRNTRETSVQVSVNLDNFTTPFIATGLNFFNHMLEQIAYHGGLGLNIICSGDIEVDDHHTVEDTAIALGIALSEALGNKKGIERYGFALPMDEAEATVLLDLGGRTDFLWDVKFTSEKIGDVSSEMFRHFFKSIAENMKCNLHIKATGVNNHHIAEGVFKAFARALKCAVKRDLRNETIASSKGSL